MNEFNEFNQTNEDEVIDTQAKSVERVMPAIVKAKKKGGKGKVAVFTVAAMLASFGAGSLYTSHNWIQQQATQNEAATNKVVQAAANASQTSVQKSTGALSVAQIANLAADSVVEITTETVQNDVFMRQYVAKGAGSGVVISKDGYIVTNNHVIEGASKITVRLKNGKEYQGKLIGRDTQTDVAVVKIEGATLTPVTYGDSSALVVGDTAVAIGNPLGQLGGTVTDGIISATDRQIQLENQTMTLLQTNAAINPGNSGGGLFNDKGQLIGVVVAKSSGSNIEGIGFAIPINVVKDVVSSIMKVGYVQGRPVLGISVVDVATAQEASMYGVSQLGVYVAKLTDGTNAKESGLKVGDCIVAIADTQVGSRADIANVLKQHKVGDTVKVMVSRSGKMITVNVKLCESKPEEETTATQKQANNSVPNDGDIQQGGDIDDILDAFGLWR